MPRRRAQVIADVRGGDAPLALASPGRERVDELADGDPAIARTARAHPVEELRVQRRLRERGGRFESRVENRRMREELVDRARLGRQIESRHHFARDGVEQLVARREVPEYRPLRHAGACRDGAHRELARRFGLEQLDGGAEDQPAGLAGEPFRQGGDGHGLDRLYDTMS